MARRPRSTAGDRRSPENESGGSLRWLLTYADMITLLMAFFIMLYSMSVLNTNSFHRVADSIRGGFGGHSPAEGTGAAGENEDLEDSTNQHEPGDLPWKAVRHIQKLIKEENLGSAVRLSADERGLVITLVTDKMLFEKGHAELTSSAKHIITSVADGLKLVPNPVRVEGHTCDLPVSSAKYASNWELSTARATTVIKYLIENEGIPASRLSAGGYADSKPVVQNSSEKNRALNRRVDIVILRSGYQDNER